MTDLAKPPIQSETHNGALWRTGVDMDLQAATALARASVTALLRLSPVTRIEIELALDEEISALALQNEPAAEAAASLIRQCAP